MRSLLTADEEKSLARKIRTGDRDARDRLVLANLNLVIDVASHYYTTKLSLDDRVQAGNVGLIHAAGKFDPEVGTRFRTYAVYWIKQSIRGAVKASHLIHVPGYMACPGGRSSAIGRGSDSLVDQADRVRSGHRVNLFDRPEDRGDHVADVEKAEELDRLQQVLSRIGTGDAEILRLRFGLRGREHSLREIGEMRGTSRETAARDVSLVLDAVRAAFYGVAS